MKTALVTGLSGFIGTHLGRRLQELGWGVRGLKRSRRGPLQDEFLAGPVDAVVHLATNTGRGHRVLMSQVVADNLLFSIRVAEEAVSQRVPIFVNADTCLPADSTYLPAYALSKKQFVEWGAKVCRGTATRFVNLRLYHLYGPGDRPEKFVPKIIRQCVESAGEIALTHGDQQRDFLYVADAVEAFVRVLAAPEKFPAFTSFDCGSGQPVTVREFVELVHRLAGSRAILRFGALPYREDEVMHYQADTGALRQLGWQPTVSLETGIKEILRQDFGQ